jgi:hypothetical protein
MMIAAFTQEEFLNSLQRFRDPRLIALKLVYTIPGYADASLETKNYIYDLVSAKVRSLIDGR